MRLIDADALEDKEFNVYDAEHEEWYRAVKSDDIETAPTIDAVPVVHGHWKEDDGRVRVCSVCETDWCHKDEMDFEQYFNFCPNCGAKMDEVQE